MEILQLNHYSFAYPEAKAPTLRDINLSVEEGEFILVVGLSGSGKTTLLRQLKPTLTPHGKKRGKITFRGKDLEDLTLREEVTGIGFVQQNPENQVVADKVWHELAFGLESLGTEPQKIRLRVGEIAGFFGMEEWFYKDVKDLSGGQLQMVSLASILALQPEILLLDEPTSQLDPIAAGEFFQALKRVSNELGITVILSEHRLGEVFALADRILYLEEGKVGFFGSPRDFGEGLAKDPRGILDSAPVPTRIYAEAGIPGTCPLTVGEGTRWISDKELSPLPKREPRELGDTALALRGVTFRYEKDGPDILKSVDMDLYKHKINCILGGNGAGKSTTLKVLSGLEKPFRGAVYDYGRKRKKGGGLVRGLSLVPQNPRSLFVKKTVREELEEMGRKGSKDTEKQVKEMGELFGLSHLWEQHPYDISGGEQQRLAVAKVMMGDPEILLMDEPTKGMDGAFKKQFAQVLRELINRGVTIVLVSHDLEFCGEVGEYCYLFFAGEVISRGVREEFFPGNHFYTTAANKMCRRKNKDIITVEDAVKCLGTSSQKG